MPKFGHLDADVPISTNTLSSNIWGVLDSNVIVLAMGHGDPLAIADLNSPPVSQAALSLSTP